MTKVKKIVSYKGKVAVELTIDNYAAFEVNEFQFPESILRVRLTKETLLKALKVLKK